MDVRIGLQVQHICGHGCTVQQEFGNLYRCIQSGLVHICDSTCNQRLYYDRYHSICRISKKLHPPLEQEGMATDDASRKRLGEEPEPLQPSGSWKRRTQDALPTC